LPGIRGLSGVPVPLSAVSLIEKLIAYLFPSHAHQLLDSIAIMEIGAVTKQPDPARPILIGLRDRALIAVMVYSFARVSAAIGMQVADYYVEGRKAWFRLYEKGGKRHEVPAHHNAADYVDAYIAAA
jgi:integrase